ncbi:MAG: carbohydrate ABC transporter permease [bacterium]
MGRRQTILGYICIAPVLLGILLFTVYPALYTIWLSFHEMSLANLNVSKFVGMKNLIRVLTHTDPSFWGQVMKVTFIFVGGSVALHIGFGLALAVLLNEKWLRGRSFFRNLYLLPWIAAGVIVGYSWSFLFNPRAGVLNYIVQSIGLEPQSWLTNPRLALPSLIVANTWRGTAFSLLIQTAGLQSISLELYDAALVDGASLFQSFRYITLPLLKPFLLLNLVLDTNGTFHVFDTIYVMTAGGPIYRTETISLFMYHQAFSMGELGMGAATALVILTVSLIISFMYFKIVRTEA